MRPKPAVWRQRRVSLTTRGRVHRYAIALLPALAIWQLGPAPLPASAQQASATRPSASGTKCELITREQVTRLAAGGDLIDVLRSRFPGLAVGTSDWRSPGGSTLGLRGRNSMVGTSEPLIFLDGVRLPQPGGLRQVELIEPLHVQRIEILPGPAATTYFGTGSSNGVVLIYTRTASNASQGDPRGGCPP